MKDFERIYDEICYQYKNKIENMQNEQKDINKYARKKLIKPIILIIIFLIILITITRQPEFLIFTIFAPGPLVIYYYMVKGSKMRTNIIPDINVIDQIYNHIIGNGFEGLTYCSNRQGISREIYDKIYNESYDNYFSETELIGNLNNKNQIELSYISTANETSDSSEPGNRHRYYLTRGYLLSIEIGNETNIKVNIDDQKVKTLNENISSIISEDIINNIQTSLRRYKEKSRMSVECTIFNNKIYLRFLTDSFHDTINLNNALNKEILKKYYDNINNIINLANEILIIVGK